MLTLLTSLTPTPIGWSNSSHHCNWKGVTCRSNYVFSINLSSNSLSGILPKNIDTLFNLTHIDLHNNSLTGTMPYFRTLPELKVVNLGHNNFTQTPYGFFTNPTLETLNLSNNLNLQSWSLSSNRVNSKFLRILDLKATNMVGSLPSNMFASLESLDTLFLSNNCLSEQIPQSLGNSVVKYLRLNDQGRRCCFTGTIEVISSMRFLSQAWLHNNLFTGTIPSVFKSTSLSDLQLKNNLLIGLIPPSLFNLPSLKYISLDINYLQGPIPSFRKGVRATWEKNYFCRSDFGPCDPQIIILIMICEALASPYLYPLQRGGVLNNACKGWQGIKCQSGKVVSINFTNLGLVKDMYPTLSDYSTISPAFSNFTSLVNLSLMRGHLMGSIPDSFTTLPQLRLLDVSYNNLTGRIPKFSSKVKLITTGNTFLQNATTSGIALRTYIWIGGAALFSVGFVISFLIIYNRKKVHILVDKWVFKKLKSPVDEFIQEFNMSVPIKQFSYAEVKKMTNSFKNKIGEGGFGSVYKGSLKDGREVAVKVLEMDTTSGEEFINEVASISRTAHVNIVALLGYCYENKRALIYEFVSRGSLDNFIGKSGDAICSLNCDTIFKIVLGIARGLDYLHEGGTKAILHFDIKPQNILLDDDFCPKIADFGLAKIRQRSRLLVSIFSVRGGTKAYMAPELLYPSYDISPQSDVYSYGLLIINMIAKKKSSNTLETIDSIYRDLEQTVNLVNSSEISNQEDDLMRKISMISLWCVQINPSDRPSMSKVIEMLQGPLESVPYPPRRCFRFEGDRNVSNVDTKSSSTLFYSA